MTSKKFDNHGNTRKLHIESASEGFVFLKIEFGGYKEYFTVSNDIIPSISLALLESAGFVGDENMFSGLAVANLRDHIEEQERSKAEAKDKAELKAEALELVNAWRDSANYTPHTNWDALEDTPVGDHWLSVARKSRELRDSK